MLHCFALRYLSIDPFISPSYFYFCFEQLVSFVGVFDSGLLFCLLYILCLLLLLVNVDCTERVSLSAVPLVLAIAGRLHVPVESNDGCVRRGGFLQLVCVPDGGEKEEKHIFVRESRLYEGKW